VLTGLHEQRDRAELLVVEAQPGIAGFEHEAQRRAGAAMILLNEDLKIRISHLHNQVDLKTAKSDP
jgi:hypothetical protein